MVCQREAVTSFYDDGRVTGGSGVVSLPCGSGKTIVALGVLNRVGAQALILSTNTTALRQWKRELLEKTTLGEEEIALGVAGDSVRHGPDRAATAGQATLGIDHG